MTAAHTPMTSNGSIVFLPGAVRLSVAGLPDSTGLAALIATACSAHQQLVDALIVIAAGVEHPGRVAAAALVDSGVAEVVQ